MLDAVDELPLQQVAGAFDESGCFFFLEDW
jgi:hypothetical protein